MEIKQKVAEEINNNEQIQKLKMKLQEVKEARTTQPKSSLNKNDLKNQYDTYMKQRVYFRFFVLFIYKRQFKWVILK